MENFKISINEIHGGIQKLYRFPNNRGASVVQHSFSYGNREENQWELAVIKFGSKSNSDWDLDYDTEITSNVLGHLSDDDVDHYLRQIRALYPAF